MRVLARFIAFIVMLFPFATAAASLHVRGNKIYYGDVPVQLQGVAVGDPVLAREGRGLEDYYRIAHDWNANVVRISVHPGTWRDHGRKKTMEQLKQNVQVALDAGMFVIIVWQAIGVPDDYMQEAPDTNSAEDLYDTDFELAQDFWRQAAAEFGKDGRIMFELWNEPVWPEMDDGTHINAHWGDLKHYWLRLVGLVRFYSENIVILTSNGWGYNLKGIRQDPIADANTVYAWHVYAGTDKDDPALWEANLDGLYFTKPVIVTEWGYDSEPGKKTSGSAEGFGYLFADRFLRDKGLHFTAWCWHPVWTPPLLQSDWQALTPYGEFVKAVLWRKDKDALVRPAKPEVKEATATSTASEAVREP